MGQERKLLWIHRLATSQTAVQRRPTGMPVLAGSSTRFSLGRQWTRSGRERSPEVSSASMQMVHPLTFHCSQSLSHRQSSSSQQSLPEFPDMSGLCTPHQRKANSETQYLPRFPGQGTATWSQLVHSWSRQLPPPLLLSSVLRTKGTGVSRLVAKATFPRLFYCRPCI